MCAVFENLVAKLGNLNNKLSDLKNNEGFKKEHFISKIYASGSKILDAFDMLFGLAGPCMAKT